MFEDDRDRLWHARCALSRLATDYRTPLSEEESTAAVSFDVVGQTFCAPHPVHILEVTLGEGVEVSYFFVGNQSIFGNFSGGTFRARDFPGGRIPVDCCAPTGIYLTLQAVSPSGAPDESARWRVAGNRVPEGHIVAASCVSPAAAIFRTDPVGPTCANQATAVFYGRFHGTHLACDDWEGWYVEVAAVGNPNTTLDVGRLAGPVTPAATCEFKTGEQVAVMARNLADHPRPFVARLYGEMLF